MMKRAKKLTRVLTGICMALLLFAGMAPMQVQAADINVTLGTQDNARAGDTVSANIVLSNNPGVSTFAMKLAYDSNYLTYTGATWANSIASNSNNVQLISEVTEDGGPVLNISSILNSTYSNNGTIVTLNFTVKQNYTTMPVTLTNREITDSSYAAVNANIVVDATAGQTNNSQNNSESQNNNNNNSQNNNSQNNNNNSQNNNSQNKNSQSNSGNSGNKNSQSSNSGKLDKTPKTGATDIRFVLGGAIVVFLLIAGLCIRVLGKKRS